MRVRRVFGIVRAAVKRPFSSLRDFIEFLTFLAVSIAGVANASPLWILIGGLALFLTTWPRYAAIYARAGHVDEQWRELGSLERAFKVGSGWRWFARARVLPTVVLWKLGHDSLFVAGAFLVGHIARWVWW
jgi:hypothetical protein